MSPTRFGASLAQAISDALPYALLVVDAEAGTIEAENPAASRVFGYWPGELIGKPVEDLIPVSLRSAHVSHRAEFVAHPSPREMGPGRELYALRKNGERFRVRIGLGPLKIQSEESMHLVVAVVHPIDAMGDGDAGER